MKHKTNRKYNWSVLIDFIRPKNVITLVKNSLNVDIHEKKMSVQFIQMPSYNFFLNSRKSCRKTLGSHFYPFSSFKHLQWKKSIFFRLLDYTYMHNEPSQMNIFKYFFILDPFKHIISNICLKDDIFSLDELSWLFQRLRRGWSDNGGTSLY